MVFADTYVVAGHVAGATLTDDDVSGDDSLSAEDLNTKTFTVGFATVFGTTDAFLCAMG